jgi:hypothetical protein
MSLKMGSISSLPQSNFSHPKLEMIRIELNKISAKNSPESNLLIKKKICEMQKGY